MISEAIMVRTVVSLEESDKRWLDERAAAEGVPMTEMIRRAVRLLRRQSRRQTPGLDDLLDRTVGVWERGDGLEYQRKTRREW
jgi:hypothetical protein